MTSEELIKLNSLLSVLPDQIFAVLMAFLVVLILRDCLK